MKFVIFLTLCLPSLVLAYIPRARTILDRVTDNAGTGTYLIEQELQFTASTEPFSLRETWVVDSEGSMRVNVTGTKDQKEQIKFSMIYSQGVRRWNSPQGPKQKPWPADSPERFWNYRTKDSLIASLIHAQILPAHVAQRHQPPRNMHDIKWIPESFVRLARVGGTTAWAFGEPTPVQGAPLPGLWIEQDLFLIRKIRFADGAEITADNYNSYSRGLQLPKNRLFHWGSNTVQGQLINATGLAAGQAKAASITGQMNFNSIPEPALRTQIEEFYSRMR